MSTVTCLDHLHAEEVDQSLDLPGVAHIPENRLQGEEEADNELVGILLPSRPSELRHRRDHISQRGAQLSKVCDRVRRQEGESTEVHQQRMVDSQLGDQGSKERIGEQ